MNLFIYMLIILKNQMRLMEENIYLLNELSTEPQFVNNFVLHINSTTLPRPEEMKSYE